MYVKNRMTVNPYTIAYDAPINDAVEIFRDNNLKRLPVTDNEKVIGILTQGDIQKVSPTKATSLSIFEINYLLSKVTVKDAMSKNPITISPDSLLEEAAVIMRKNRIGTLPVVENNKIIGIITESDIFDAFIDLLGFKENGSRITVESKDVPGALADMADIFKSFDANITHIVAYHGDNGKSDVVIRTNTLNTNEIEKRLLEHGYRIEHVLKNDKK
ncbi:CBS and ACT domain-containing protein [Sedimentibacter sp. MB31-C6]|uniref:CBS and ACT domain-containing protein n=1 Tax=Sedimentibacter sp. MB31-C6 TaxID=3109366 RepID=UPI002DDD9664|nr:CBS and ACT domain-containing protein [Sedimentibacter sp. MB36-C1]WSI05252.1 CBS and ACT domain-containing protein [Sedimentibacter sp. MB36-C1]